MLGAVENVEAVPGSRACALCICAPPYTESTQCLV